MTQNRDELNSKISEAMKDRATTWGGFVKWDELAEACLSAIEQSGYVIVRRESVETAYKAMHVLSSSPFNTQGEKEE